VLEARTLRNCNIIGCVEPLAFGDGAHYRNRSGSALVLSVECGDGVEAFTFDSRAGALPDLGQTRFTEALEPGMSPHFLLFAGAKSQESNDSIPNADAIVLSEFRRRVDGLFPGSTTFGVLVRGDELRPGRLIHARRRRINTTNFSSTQQHTQRAGRLKVYRAHGGAVGVALLPRSKNVSVQEMSDCASSLSRLAFGGQLALRSSGRDQSIGFRNPLSRLWAAGDGTMGNEEHRVHAALMAFFKAFDEADADAMEAIWLDERETGSASGIHAPTLVQSGSKLIRGYECIQSAWRKAFQDDGPSLAGNSFNSFLRQNFIRLTTSKTNASHDTSDAQSDPLDCPSYGIQVEDLHIVVAQNFAYATCILNLADDDPNQATTVLTKDSTDGKWSLIHFHCSTLDDDDDDDDDENDDEHIMNFEEDEEDDAHHGHRGDEY